MTNFWAVRDAQRSCVFQGDESGRINIAPSPPPVVGRAAPDGFEYSTCALLKPGIYDAAVDGVRDSQTHSDGIATPASCHRRGAEAL